MKNKIFTIALACIALLFTSCDRSGVFEEFQQDIPWNFCVKVCSDENNVQPISDVTVQIFKSEEARTAGQVFLSKTTDSKGEALFTAAEFGDDGNGSAKGYYYIKVSKGSLFAEATTYYLLMNSGTTYQYIQLQ